MYTQRVSVKTVSLNSLHHPKTLALTVSGKDAYRTTQEELLIGFVRTFSLKPSEVAASYQFEEPLKWFLKLGEAAERRMFDTLHGKQFNISPDKKVLVEEVGRERAKIILHWVPPTLPKEGVEEMILFLAKEEVEAFPHKGRNDRWTVLYRPEQGKKVPHYLLMDCGELKDKKILVLVPGRKQACFHCGSLDHWTSKCPKRNNTRVVEKTRVETDTTDKDMETIQPCNSTHGPIQDAVISTEPAAVAEEEGWQVVENGKGKEKRKEQKVLEEREKKRSESSPTRSYAEVLTDRTPPSPTRPPVSSQKQHKRQLEDQGKEKDTKIIKRGTFEDYSDWQKSFAVPNPF